jgi:hypothetical protein
MVRVARGEGSKAEELDYEGDREVLLLEEVNMGELRRKMTGGILQKECTAG